MVNKTYRSIFITWDAVPTNHTNDEIFGYEVEYSIIEGGQPAWEKRKVFSVPTTSVGMVRQVRSSG